MFSLKQKEVVILLLFWKSQSLEVESSARLILTFKLFSKLIVLLFKQFPKGRWDVKEPNFARYKACQASHMSTNMVCQTCHILCHLSKCLTN